MLVVSISVSLYDVELFIGTIERTSERLVCTQGPSCGLCVWALGQPDMGSCQVKPAE